MLDAEMDSILSKIEGYVRMAILEDRKKVQEQVLKALVVESGWAEPARVATEIHRKAIERVFRDECPSCGTIKH